MVIISTKCTKLFCFLVERLYREFLYLFGIGPRCRKENLKYGAAYVEQLIKNVADDGRYKLHPFHSNTSLMGCEAWLGFILVKWEIKLCHGGISGLKTLQQADCCSFTMMKNLVHVNTSLRAGPIDFDSWVIVSFFGFEHGFFVKGTLSHAKFFCDFTINSETNKSESFDYLMIREIKGMKIWVEEGLGLLKWPVNLAVHLVISFLKPFIRNAVECLLENLVKDDFSNYEFPAGVIIETSSLEESSKEHNAIAREHVSESAQIAQPNTSKFFSFSYWYDSARSYLRRKSPVLFIDCPLNSKYYQSKETTENEGYLEGHDSKNETNCPFVANWKSDYQTRMKEQSLQGYRRTPNKKQTDEASKLAKEMKLSSNAVNVGSKLCQTGIESSTVEESRFRAEDLEPLTVMEDGTINENIKRVNVRGYLEGLGCRDISGFSDQYSRSKDSFVYLLSYSAMMPKSTDAVELDVPTDVEAAKEKFLIVVEDMENSTANCEGKVMPKSYKVEYILPDEAEMTATYKAASGEEDGHRNAPYKGEKEHIDFSVTFEEMRVLEDNIPLERRELLSTNPKFIPDTIMQKESSPLKQRGLKSMNPMSFQGEIDTICESGFSSQKKCLQAKLPLEAEIKLVSTTDLSVTAEGPKSIPEGSMHQENCLLRRQGLQPASTQSRPERKTIPRLISHLKAKMEHLATTNEPVDVTTEKNNVEKLLMEADWEASVSSKDECSEVKLQHEGKMEHTSSSNESVVVDPKGPKSVPERKITKEKSPFKLRGLKPVNLKSRPEMKIPKQSCHLKTKIEPATASSESVDVTTERNGEENLPLEVEMDKTCETRVSLKEECDQAILSIAAEIKPVATSNESVDGAKEGDFEEKLVLEGEMDAACKAGVLSKDECSHAKLPLEGKMEHTSSSNESVVVDPKGPKSVPERKITKEKSPFKLRGLKPVNLKSRPEIRIHKQSCHLKTKIEPTTASSESVDVTTERNGEENLPLKVEMNKTCETGVSSKEEYSQAMLPLKAEIEPVTGTNESVDVTTEANVEEKLLEVELNATCQARVSSTEKCTQAKLPLEAEIEPASPVSATNEFVVVTAEGPKFIRERKMSNVNGLLNAGGLKPMNLSISKRIMPKKTCPSTKIELVASTIDSVDETAEGDTEEKLLNAEMDATCDSAVSPKEECAQVKFPFQTKVEPVVTINGDVNATIGGDTKEEALEVEMNTTCKFVVSPKDEFAEEKELFEADFEILNYTDEFEVATGDVGTKGKIAS